MECNIFTTISTNEIFDNDGKILPSGNYYFHLTSFRDGNFYGELQNRGNYGVFSFSAINVVKMMAVAQARLARRCRVRESGMPTYSSPVLRRRSRLPPTNPPIPQSPPTCSICLDSIRENSKRLPCSHIFHESCINRWFQNSNLCPLCRRRGRLPANTNRVPFRPPPPPPRNNRRRQQQAFFRSNVIIG